MKKTKRTLLIILAFALLTAALYACGSEEERPRLTMATNADFPPFEFINDAGEYDGFDVHLARAIADLLGMELVIENMEFGAVVAAVETGRADVGIAAMTITEERLLSVNFTVPYFETTLVVIVPQGSDITSPDQLHDMRIAVQLGTTSDLFCEEELPDADITRLNRAPDTVLELRSGRVDAIVVDRDVALQFIGDNPDLVILDEVLGEESYGMAINKDNTDLLNNINRAIQELKASGEYDRVFNMFFETES